MFQSACVTTAVYERLDVSSRLSSSKGLITNSFRPSVEAHHVRQSGWVTVSNTDLNKTRMEDLRPRSELVCGLVSMNS